MTLLPQTKGRGVSQRERAYVMFKFKKTERARELRRQQTLAERKLWWLIRSRALAEHKFHRQYPIGPFIVDFCCRRKKLIIELDGSQHADDQEYDEERTLYLEQQGYQVIRFWNNQVLSQSEAVLQSILNALLAVGPLPLGEGGRRPGEGSPCD